MAADFISRRALAPVFDGNQKSAARLIGVCDLTVALLEFNEEQRQAVDESHQIRVIAEFLEQGGSDSAACRTVRSTATTVNAFRHTPGLLLPEVPVRQALRFFRPFPKSFWPA